ncbi:MAG: carbon-nitrogen hydrolase family protein, partial [Planctomycetaceae bacterium]
AACLVGVPLVSQVMVERYGLQIPEGRRVNGACIVGPSGEIACHEKLSLLPIREGLPEFLDTPWVRHTLLPYYRLEATLKPGSEFRLLPFTTQDGRRVRIAAAICYESHLPWLPQYQRSNGADAVVHLTYDGDFAGHPAWADRHLLACRYRAVESRTWNLVCSTWSGSAIIDPAGNIVARLPAEEGVLRSEGVGNSE